MGTNRATKAADKSQVCRKFVLALHKAYGKSVPKIDLPVIETMLFATCLEDNAWAPAEAGLKTLISSFYDLNEIRVSSVGELEQVLAPLEKADWKGLRIRSILRFVFESTYSYDFEKIRRQTLEQAIKTLKKIPDITPFIRDFVLHEILGSHIVCLDGSMLTAAKWLGLVPIKDNVDEASEFLKGGLKKSEVSEFCYLLRCLATDPKFVPRFADAPDSELSMLDVMDRWAELQLPPKKKVVKPTATKDTEKSSDARKSHNVKADAKSSKTEPAQKSSPTGSPKAKKPGTKTVPKSASKSITKPSSRQNTATAAKKPSAPGKTANQTTKKTATVKPTTGKVTKKK